MKPLKLLIDADFYVNALILTMYYLPLLTKQILENVLMKLTKVTELNANQLDT